MIKQYDTDGIKSFSNTQSDLSQLIYNYFSSRKQLREKYETCTSEQYASATANLANELMKSNLENIINTIYIALSGMVYYIDIMKDFKSLQKDIDSILDAIDILKSNNADGVPAQILMNDVSKKINNFVRSYRSIACLCLKAVECELDDEEDEGDA